jgi:hypothetical protein
MNEELKGEAVQVVARVHHNQHHAEPVRAVLNSIGLMLPDDERLMTIAQHHRLMAAKDAEIARLWRDRHTDAKLIAELRAQHSAPAERGVVLESCAQWCDRQASSDWCGRKASDMVREFGRLNPAPAEQQPAAVVPEGWREFIEDCATTAGSMVNGNRLSIRASELLAAAPAPARCEYCDDTGDVHSLDGEWKGSCVCPAGQAPVQQAEKKPFAWALTLPDGRVTLEKAYPCWIDGDMGGDGYIASPLYTAPSPAAKLVGVPAKSLKVIEAELARITHDAFTSTDTSQELAAVLIVLRALLATDTAQQQEPKA